MRVRVGAHMDISDFTVKDWTYFRGVYVVHAEVVLQGTRHRRERKHVGRSLGYSRGAQQTDTLRVQTHLGHTAGGLQRRGETQDMLLQASYDGTQLFFFFFLVYQNRNEKSGRNMTNETGKHEETQEREGPNDANQRHERLDQ